MQAGSYFLKRVAPAGADGRLAPAAPVEYLGDEQPADGNGPQQNYVVDPWSLSKPDDADNAAALYDNYYTSFGTTPAGWEKIPVTAPAAADGKRWATRWKTP